MKANEGKVDRIVRVILGLILIPVGILMFEGVLMWVLIAAGAISLITGVIGFCGLYALFGINTNKTK